MQTGKANIFNDAANSAVHILILRLIAHIHKSDFVPTRLKKRRSQLIKNVNFVSYLETWPEKVQKFQIFISIWINDVIEKKILRFPAWLGFRIKKIKIFKIPFSNDVRVPK